MPYFFCRLLFILKVPINSSRLFIGEIMKILCFACVFISFNSLAGVSRAPAVIAEQCDVDIPTTMIDEKSAKEFMASVNHKILVHSDDELGCSKLNKQRYPDSVYRTNAQNEIEVLFQKYPEKYSQKCKKYYGDKSLKSFEYTCETAKVASMTFSKYSCDKIVEEGTHKVSYVSTAYAEINYKQVGKSLIEKPIELVQKEQCARTKECLDQATEEKDKKAYKKLADVACKSDIVPVTTARVPALQQDPSLNDGERISEPKLKINKVNELNNSDGQAAVAK